MAIQIPLNKFASRFVDLTVSPNLSTIYTTPERRATIVILAQASNTTNQTRTVTFGVSTFDPNFGVDGDWKTIVLADRLAIPPNDARPLLTGRLVTQGVDFLEILKPDHIFVRDTTDSQGVTGLNITLGLLETINVD